VSELANPRRERFCQEYVIDRNGQQAAIRAKYAAGSAKVTASRLLTDDNVQARIKELAAPVVHALELTQEKVLGDIERTRALAEENGKYSAALRACELQGKHVGLWPDAKLPPAAIVDNRTIIINGSDLEPEQREMLRLTLQQSRGDEAA
jgi:hypothetical protein